jgi:heme oxygenase (biliverdin-IX-beta and delta-forming)
VIVAPSPPCDIFERLKEGTSEIHRRIEERVPVFRDGFVRADYVRLLERFYGFWGPLEAELARLNVLRDKALDLEGRLKGALLQQDLHFLGREPANVPRCHNLPAVDTFQRALGCLYVMEGSTLGARIISRRLEEHLQFVDGSGASFFNAYGAATGRNWNAFRRFVIARVTPEDTAEIVAAARQTFQNLFEWLGKPDLIDTLLPGFEPGFGAVFKQ